MTRYLTLGGALVVFFYLLGTGLLIVDDSELVLITRFGEPVREITSGGLAVKWPDPIESAVRLDKRLHLVDADESELLTSDNKNLVTAAFVLWRVSNPQRFLESVKNRKVAERRLVDLVSSELGVAVSQHRMADFFTTAPAGNRIAEILDGIVRNCNTTSEKSFGIQVVDVRLRHLGFPEETVRSIYNRMQVEREKIAKKYRAEGEEQAARLRAVTDKEVRELLAGAYRKAQVTKGEAEAKAIGIYAAAFGKDPDFYKLVRTLDAYETFIDEKTTLILSADSPLFRFLESPPELAP